MTVTVRTLFDAALAVYDYDGMGDRELSHSILIIGHVFFANILLMNYLIAILSTTYENMKQSGIFKYKVNLYQYCERYMIAFENRYYGEMILHPPPLSYMSAVMLFFLPCKKFSANLGIKFSKLMFWIENTVFISIFIAFEIAIAIPTYLKIWFNILKSSVGVFGTIVNCLIWAVAGIPWSFFLVFRDTYYLIKILKFHDGCRSRTEDIVELEIPMETKIRVYNETRLTVINVYKWLRNTIKQVSNGANDEEEANSDDEDEQDFFKIEEGEVSEDYLYVVKKHLVIEEWKKKRAVLERKRRIINRQEEVDASPLKNILISSFKKKYLGESEDKLQALKGSIVGSGAATGTRHIGGMRAKDIKN